MYFNVRFPALSGPTVSRRAQYAQSCTRPELVVGWAHAAGNPKGIVPASHHRTSPSHNHLFDMIPEVLPYQRSERAKREERKKKKKKGSINITSQHIRMMFKTRLVFPVEQSLYSISDLQSPRVLRHTRSAHVYLSLFKNSDQSRPARLYHIYLPDDPPTHW